MNHTDCDEMIKKYMIKFLQKIWAALSDKLLEKLAVLMINRIKTVLMTEEWYTKY